jgi:hypothetical protein
VGWIFTPRLPIRGPKSRAATAETKRRDPSSAAAKAAELAKAAKKASKRSTKKADPPVETSWPITPAKPPPDRAKVDPALSHAIDDAVEEALHPPEPTAEEAVPDKKKAAGAKKAAAKSAKAAKKKEPAAEAGPKKAAPVKKQTASTKKAAAKKAAASKPEAQLAAAPARGAGRATTPPPAVNEPLSFINFVAAFKVGSTLEGEVVSFTSHGAMVDVALPDGGLLHCYIPLVAMGNPPPTKAREVLKKGEVRSFVLAGLDPPRRVAELSLPVPPAKKKRAPAKKAAKASG